MGAQATATAVRPTMAASVVEQRFEDGSISLLEASSDSCSESNFEETYTSCDADIYVLTMYATMHRLYFGVVTAWCWLLACVASQIYLVYIVGRFINVPKGFQWRDQYNVRLTHVLRHDLPLNTTAGSADAALIDQCSVCPSVGFTTLALFLWTLKMLGEGFLTCRLFVLIFGCPNATCREETGEGGDDKFTLMGLRVWERPVFFVALCACRFVTDLMIWIVGYVFLVYTSDIETVIFKALSLFFIATIGDIVIKFIYSKETLGQLKNIKVRQVWPTKMKECRKSVFPWQVEALKFALALSVIAIMYFVYMQVFIQHYLCWKCETDCTKRCSEAFKFCRARGRLR